MEQIEEDIKIKFENIDKAKKDLDSIKRFEEIYCNFKILNAPNNYPKIIRDSEPSSIGLNEEHTLLEEKDQNNKNLTYFITENSFFSLSDDEKENSRNNNNINKLAKSYVELNREKLNIQALEIELRKKIEEKNSNFLLNEKRKQRKKIHDIINNNKMKKINKRRAAQKHISKVYNAKYNNNKKFYEKKSKRSMKDIYQRLFGVNEEISLSTEKKVEVKNIFKRLYNQGFYTKNKSQINILENINEIKKDSKRENISENSKKILGLSKNKQNKNKNNISKYDKNNIFKPIKTNMESSYTKFEFHPTINETTKKLVKNMEKSFTRITKPKNEVKIEFKKKKISKEKYEQILNRINFLYLDGVDKVKKKRKLKSCPPSNDDDSFELNLKYSKDYLNRSSSLIKQSRNSKNLYYNQIQWKKKVLLENEKKKEIKENIAQSNCTFKPKIITKSIKYLFQKSKEKHSKSKNDKNNSKILNKSLKNIQISKARYFIINDDNKATNESKIDKMSLKIKYKRKEIEHSLLQRKSYHLEKFFS